MYLDVCGKPGERAVAEEAVKTVIAAFEQAKTAT
jgi:hypothetical protein